MSDQTDSKDAGQVPFLQRWSRRKTAERAATQSEQSDPQTVQSQEQTQESSPQSLPPIESLHESSDIGMFLADGVSESLQRQALRKLFHFQKFNFCDGLDDYAEDYTIFKPLEKLLGINDKFQDIGDRLLSTEAPDLNSQSETDTSVASVIQHEDEANDDTPTARQVDDNED